MSKLRSELALAAACLAFSAAAVVRWRRALDGVAPVSARPRTLVRAPATARLDDDSIADAAAFVAENDPFRLSSAPASVAYSPAMDAGPSTLAQPVVAHVRPNLVLRGIIGGPPWQAIVDGIPGQPAGAIVRQGMAFDAITIRTVTRDTVFVQSPDTSWKLTLARSAP